MYRKFVRDRNVTILTVMEKYHSYATECQQISLPRKRMQFAIQ